MTDSNSIGTYPVDDLVIVTDESGAPLPGQDEALAAEVREPLQDLDTFRAWAALTLPASPEPCSCTPRARCLRCRVAQLLAR